MWPLPKDVKEAIDSYLKLDRKRRKIAHSGGEEAFLFQPHTNYRTLEFSKALSTRMAQKVVKQWAEYSRIGDLSPHDLRRTAITKALDPGLSYRQVQMMSKHRDPKTVMRYDHGRENLVLVSSLVFGVGHLPIAFMILPEVTFALTLFVIAANSIFGLIAGYLYWKKGLESAMIAHMLTHVLLLTASYFGAYF